MATPHDGLASMLAEVRAALGEHAVVTDPDVVAAHGADWTGRWRVVPPAVVRPGSTEQVAAVVRSARRHGVGLVPQGGNTGLVGGGVPRHAEVVVDLRGIRGLEPVDRDAQQVTVGAGTTLAALQAHAAAAGLAFPVDLGARDSATVGGMVATNAGGVHVLRHGPMRAQLLGVEAVLGTGEVVVANLAGLVKDNSGYDLPGLLCGSEGTLGIVTRARLRLVPEPAGSVVALLGLPSVAAAVTALGPLRTCPSLHAVELMLADGLGLVGAHLGVPLPFAPAPPCAVLVELAGDGDLLGELGRALAALGELVLGSAVGADAAGRARLWRWREAHPEAAAGLGVVHKADVAVPLAALAGFVEQVGAVVGARAPDASLLVYGHLGDGNLHVNVATADVEDGGAVDAVLALALEVGGSVSAEHGIGVAKVAWLERQRGGAAVEAMRAIKAALDPDGVCNPGVLLPPVG